MSKVIFMEKGEPNLYSVIKNGNWLMAVQHNGQKVTFYPYTGWHTGKTIKDGRGIHKPLKQL